MRARSQKTGSNPLQKEFTFDFGGLKQKIAQRKLVQKRTPQVTLQRNVQARVLKEEHAKRWITKRYLEGVPAEELIKQWKLTPEKMDLFIQELHKKDSTALGRREVAVHERNLLEKRARWAHERIVQLKRKAKRAQEASIIPGLGVTPIKKGVFQKGVEIKAKKAIRQESPNLANFVLPPKQIYRAEELFRHIRIGESKSDIGFRAKQLAIEFLLKQANPVTLEEIHKFLTTESNLAVERKETGKALKELELVGALKKQRGTTIYLIDPYWIKK